MYKTGLIRLSRSMRPKLQASEVLLDNKILDLRNTM